MHPHRRLLRERHGARARAKFNLVAPLASTTATAMRTTDTPGQLDLFSDTGRSGAVGGLIGHEQPGLRPADVTCASDGSTPTTRTTPGARTSTGATRTTGTRTTRSGLAPSADRIGAGFLLPELLRAWLDCRRTKRTTPSALAFEARAEELLAELYADLVAGTYEPGRSICFVITHPKPREVWAAPFRDRVVHHLLYNRIGERFERAFIADSCACIKGRGTAYAGDRLEAKVRSITGNWSRRAHYLKCDLANFFVSIDKTILDGLLASRINEPGWLDLARVILWNDPRRDAEVKARPHELARIPAHKSLFNQPDHLGLPIGNLSSQFFANVYLDPLDQFIKHRLRARHYVRYVDDFILLHDSPRQLNAWRDEIAAFLDRELHLRLNDSKTILQPVERGIDFVGRLIKPWRSITRRRTVHTALRRIATVPAEDVWTSANSYLGLLRQASHSHTDRARIANAIRRRGHAVDHHLTKTYQIPQRQRA